MGICCFPTALQSRPSRKTLPSLTSRCACIATSIRRRSKALLPRGQPVGALARDVASQRLVQACQQARPATAWVPVLSVRSLGEGESKKPNSSEGRYSYSRLRSRMTIRSPAIVKR